MQSPLETEMNKINM